MISSIAICAVFGGVTLQRATEENAPEEVKKNSHCNMSQAEKSGHPRTLDFGALEWKSDV